MSTLNRKLVTVRRVDAVAPIEGADAIEVATVGGWQVVVKKGEVTTGDLVVYAEIDSFLPDGNPAWQFLVDKQGREFNGVRGHRLRTVKLRGQISQGFIVPLSALPQITDPQENVDYAELLGVVKWEPPLPAELAGQAEGLFPSFIRKTDQERCQNMVDEIFGYEDSKVLIEGLAPEQADQEAILSGRLAVEDGKVYSVRTAKADRDARYEVSLKMDGSSCTVFAKRELMEDGAPATVIGVCSRNLQLKVNEANANNTFISVALKSGLLNALEKLARDGEGNVAVQGELVGEGIQGNQEKIKGHQLFVFDIQDLDKQTYLTPEERRVFMEKLYGMGVSPDLVKHVPILHVGTSLQELGIHSMAELLAFADGPSLNPTAKREGLVFKRMDGQFSFKAISNQYLAKEKD